mmetsp:Transcript_10575/g.29886  ORF Transcript_10575/g.29886 Transcript_10575/m.29886 type:complete len:83 (+) Transcript_10575:142-390(+)
MLGQVVKTSAAALSAGGMLLFTQNVNVLKAAPAATQAVKVEAAPQASLQKSKSFTMKYERRKAKMRRHVPSIPSGSRLDMTV